MTIEAVMALVTGRLTGDAYFSQAGHKVPVTDAGDKDLQSKYAEQTGRLKVHVLVQCMGVNELLGESPKPAASTLKVVCMVRENYAVNRGAGGTGKTAQAVAQKILELFWLWPVPGAGGCVQVKDLQGMTDDKVSGWDVELAVPWCP